MQQTSKVGSWPVRCCRHKTTFYGPFFVIFFVVIRSLSVAGLWTRSQQFDPVSGAGLGVKDDCNEFPIPPGVSARPYCVPSTGTDAASSLQTKIKSETGGELRRKYLLGGTVME